MGTANVAGISFELSFDGSKMMSSINSSCRNIRSKFEQSFTNAGQSATKSISSSNEKIKAILSDTEKTAKSKAASIAAVYRNEGDSAEEAFRKAWSHIERDSAESSGKVKKHFFGMRSSAKNTASKIEKDFGKSFNTVSSLAKKTGAILASAFAVKKIVDFGKSCLELGSDLSEVQNVVDVTFPSMTAQVDKFAKSAAQSFGLLETMAKKFTSMFGTMARQFGFSEQAAYDMGTTLAGLAGDVASFYNMTQDEAYTKLKAVFSGETEVLKDIGIVMTQTALDAYAMANGFGKTTQQMSEAEKVALRYAFVQNQLTAATGDFARTSDSWANQVRIMKLQMDSLKATLGQGLINLFTPVIKVINTVLGKLSTLANAFKSFTELITGKKSQSGKTAAPVAELGSVASVASESLDNSANAADGLSKATKGVGNSAKKAAKEMRALMGFDQINRLDDTSLDDTGDTSSPSTGGSSGIGGSAVDFGSLAQGETVIDQVDSKFTKMFQNIVKWTKPATDALKKLWNEGLSRLGNFVWGSLKDFYKDFLVPVGKWVMGKGLPDFVNTLNNGLMKVDFGKIRSSLRKLWKALSPFAINVGEGLLWFWENALIPLGTWTANEVVPRFLDTLRIGIDALNKIIEALQPLFQWFWDKVLLPITQWTGGVFLQVWDGINGALQKFSDWCIEHIPTIDGVKNAFAGMHEWLAKNETILQLVAVAIGTFTAALGLNALASNAASIAMGGTSIAIGVYNGITAIATTATSVFGAVIGFLTSPITLVVAAIGGLIAAGVLLYKNWDTISKKAIEIWTSIKDFFARTWENIKRTATNVWTRITSVLSSTWERIKSTASRLFGNIKTTISNIWDNLKTTAKTTWEKIKDFISEPINRAKEIIGRTLDTVSDKFSSVFESIKNAVRTPLNAIIGFLNGLIRGVARAVNSVADMLNHLRIDAPQWVTDLTGITSVGFNLPTWSPGQIPYLAQGGYVKKNAPQLAMIGDNRHQGEVVAPEDKLREMAMEAVRAAGNGFPPEILAILKQILELLLKIKPVTIDEEALRKYFIEKTNAVTKSTGKCEIKF